MKKRTETLKIVSLICLVTAYFSGCGNLADFMGDTSGDSSCEHTYVWVPSEDAHYKQYTCGCPSPDIAQLHFDDDENAVCDACEYLMVSELQLSHIMQKLPFEYNLDYFSEKYNLYVDVGFYVVDNPTDYCELLDDVGVPYEGPFDWLFEENVMLCYLRAVSGSTDFIPVKYSYDRVTNEIVRKTVVQPSGDGEYSDILICECVDMVQVPKVIFEKMNVEK